LQTSVVEEKELTRAKNTAYRYLTFRPRSRAEVEVKLRDKEFSDVVVGQVLSELSRLGYVNDRQFANQWASARVRLRGFGRRRIEQELKRKGVDPEIIRETFAEVFSGEAEVETARKAAEKKLSSMPLLDGNTRRRRLAGFLERKGFSFEIIRTVLRDTRESTRSFGTGD
jgi:regulatory protein